MPEQDTTAFSPSDLSAGAEAALTLAEQAGARAPALIEAWVKGGNAPAVAAVAERGAGAARKAARRGLNVLGARGIKVDTGPRVVPVAGAASAEQLTEAWLVPPDPGGTLLIVIASRSITSRAQSAFFYLHDSVGIRDVSTAELSGGRIRDALRRASQSGLEPVRIPLAYARFRIAAARRQLKERGLAEPLAMTNAEELLQPVSEFEAHPFDAEGLTLADEDVKEYAARSGNLHALPEFRGWLPPREAVEQLLHDVGQQLPQGEAKPDPELVQKALSEAINAATDRHFIPERRASLVRLLKDTALSVLATAGEMRALEVVAAIRRIEAAGLITDPPHEVPFLRVFFEKAVATLALQDGGRLRVPVGRAPEETPAT